MFTTCLWSHDNRALEMAEYYTSIFPDSKITSTGLYDEANPHIPGSKAGDVMIVEFTLSGVPFATLSGGPYFKIDPSISFFVNCTSKEELQTLWDTLVEGGEVLMPLDTYPWSEKYGWLSDKYGVNWQLFHTPEYVSQKITPCLTFTKERAGMAEEAMKHYSEVFPQSGIDLVARYEAGEGDVEGHVKYGGFHLGNFSMVAMDSSGPHDFSFSCAVSFMIDCNDQADLDYYYDKLSANPKAEMCGWIEDKYGVSWQLNPANFVEYMRSGTAEGKSKLMRATMEMRRLTWDGVEQAYHG